MSTSTYLVIRLDADDRIPETLQLKGSLDLLGNTDPFFNAEVTSANCAEDAARASGLSKVGPTVGEFLKVRVVTLASAYRFEACDYRAQRLPSPVEFVLTSTHETDRE